MQIFRNRAIAISAACVCLLGSSMLWAQMTPATVRTSQELTKVVAKDVGLPEPTVPASQSRGQTGMASWYGPGFHGRYTSSGEVYNKDALTAAHRSLAFGTYVRVVDLDNMASVVVRINDRGPFVKDRIIDLSEAAALMLGMTAKGTAQVRLEPIPANEALAWRGSPPEGQGTVNLQPVPAAPPIAQAPGDSIVAIQIASFSKKLNADATIARLAASGISASIDDSSGNFRVLVKNLTKGEAITVQTKLDSLGYRGYLVKTTTNVAATE